MNSAIAIRIGRAAARAVLLVNPLVVAAFTLLGGFEHFWSNFWIGLTVAETATVVGFLSAYSLLALEHHFYARRSLNPPTRSKLDGLAIAAVSLPLGVYLGLELASAIFGLTFELGLNLVVGSGVGALVLLIYAFIDARARLREAESLARVKEAQLEQVRLEAQVSVLTAQMNPHLLFNVLNTAAERVHGDPDAAESMILELAELYRRVLEASQLHTQSLARELEICQLYVDVQRARFGERLRYAVVLAADLDPSTVDVPCLILQPLVENAIVHGIGPRREGGKITVHAERGPAHLCIEVRDDGVGLVASSRGSGTGSALKNLRARLALLYGEAGRLDLEDDGGVVARVTLPLNPKRQEHDRCAS